MTSPTQEIARGAIRRSQTVTTFGVGALIDLPRHSGIVGGLEFWKAGPGKELDQITEPRLARKLAGRGAGALPRLYAPPPASDWPGDPGGSVAVFLFPEWFLVREPGAPGSEPDGGAREVARRLVHRLALDGQGRYERKPVVATRFVRACPRGHVDDIRWQEFVHPKGNPCRGNLKIIESGMTGDLADLRIRCSCGASRILADAKDFGSSPLGTCSGKRPWLGRHAAEPCNQPARLLIRTASNAWFPQIVTALSLPARQSPLDAAVAEYRSILEIAEDPIVLGAIRKSKPAVAEAIAGFSDEEVLEAISRHGDGVPSDRPTKQAELDALLAAPEGFGDDVPVEPDFHARALPERIWKHSSAFDGLVERVIQVHRLREVAALAGFTRFEAPLPGIDGEYESDVERAALAIEPSWFPAVENRGEGVFVQLDGAAVVDWTKRASVGERLRRLAAGHERWNGERKKPRAFPGGPYVLLHTLSHLLLQSVALRCGYPAASIRERIYLDEEGHRYGLLLYTASPDAEGTLGGLVQEARRIEGHLASALETASLCSNDPVCAQHEPGESMEKRWLHGAACHGCAFVAETSCEMRNDYLDRALVAPAIGWPDAAFFPR